MRTSEKVHELFLNYACNAKCAFCYNPPITPELLRLELTFDAAARSLYAGARGGARLLNLHGGEPTLRDDLPKLLALAKKSGYSQVTVVTNGVRLRDARYARRLVTSGATHFRVSIHSAVPAEHDAILEIPGGFAAAVKGLGHLRALGVPVGLNFVLHRSNLTSLPAFLQRFCVQDGIRDVIVYFPHLRGMMAINAGEIAVSYAEAAPAVRAGVALLDAAGLGDSLLLANFVPCALPELAGRMLDWEGEGAAGAAQTHPEGFTEDIVGMKHDQRIPVEACATCSLNRRCTGVEREYVQRNGRGGFVPVREGVGVPC